MKPDKLREFLMHGAVLVVQMTPFKNDGAVDYEGLRENTSFLVEKRHCGPLVLVPVGSTGEKSSVTDEEWKRIVKTVVDVADEKIPVIPGASHSGTMVAVERSKFAEDVGADGVMVVLPYYLVPEEEGLYLHYKKISDSINIGVIIYNNPDVSKIYMKPHVLKRIVENTTNIVGVKENTPYIPTLYSQIKAAGDRVPILQGRGEWWFASTVFLGVKGYISGYANFMPEFSLDLLKAGLNGDFVELKQKLQMLDPFEDYAAKMSQKYGPSTSIMPYPYASSYMMYGVFKAAMDMLGLAGGHMRLPMLDIKDEDKKELRDIIFEKWNLNKVK